ncbi:hypothetical protein I4U23_004336 [Adineta vaga]|nr:hypothetical protein I4U23_004336 [Adineta vaga]
MRFEIYFLVLIVVDYIETNGDKSLQVDIYPGFGWDNLRFMEMSPIFDISNFNNSKVFQSCIEMIPVHENKIELGSVSIDLFDERTTEYSSNIFIGGSVGYYGFKISGSYSHEFQRAKKEQGTQKTIMLRNQIDYVMVDVVLQPSCPLSPQVKHDLIEIAEYHNAQESTMATYAAQLFVKKYGTHLTTRLHLGGSITEEDFIDESTYQTSETEKTSYRAAAEASKKKIVRKIINSKCGKVSLLGQHMSNWQASVEERPAIIRRATENITFFIQSDKIPELSEIDLAYVREKINQAVETYVEMNLIKGCMKRSSPSFNWIANVDDSSKCDRYRLRNFYTGTNDCPPDFKKSILHQSIQIENKFIRKCHDCGFLWLSKCCSDVVDGIGQRESILYGCNRNNHQERTLSGILKVNNRYVYGGSFTSTKVNPVTGTSHCSSEKFTKVRVTDDMTICLAESVSNIDSLPHYGGIYSCEYGNIAFNNSKKDCLPGYSVYVMGATEGSCLLYICLKFEKFDDIRELPSVVSPPFFTIDIRNQTMHKNAPTEDSTDQSSTNAVSTSRQSQAALALSIISILLWILATATIIIFLQIKKRRQQNTTMT